MTLDPKKFSSNSAVITREFLIRTYLPEEDITKTLNTVSEIVPLRYGSYENVSFQSFPGVQRFRPISGAYLGEQPNALEESVVELVFSVPHDEEILKSVIDAIFSVHRDEEPVIFIEDGWTTRAKSYSDKSNPHRFWNRPDFDGESR